MACGDDKFCHRSIDEAQCPCVPLKCSDVPNACGEMPDTCGGTVQCSSCTPPLECGGGGVPNQCGDPANCVPLACEPGACGAGMDSCGNPRTCPDCPLGKKCTNGACVPCTPNCIMSNLACGDDGCGRSCGECPDNRWQCVPSAGAGSPGVCCIRANQQCTPLTEGCNCCPGLFCISGFCVTSSGCAAATDYTGYDPEALRSTGEILLSPSPLAIPEAVRERP